MKKLFTLLLLVAALFPANAQPAAELVPYFSYRSTYFIPDQQALDRTSTYKVRVFSRASNLFYAQDQTDNGAVFAESYGFRIYRVRNTWSSALLLDPVHFQQWHDSSLVDDEYISCGGSCVPELYPAQSVGGFTVSYSGNPEWGNAYYAVNTSAQTRIRIINGDPTKNYTVELVVGAQEITDRSPNAESTLPVPIPSRDIRIPNGVVDGTDGHAFVTIPGNGGMVNITPYTSPSREFFTYSLVVYGVYQQ